MFLQLTFPLGLWVRRKPAALRSSVKPRFLIHLDLCEYASAHLSMCQYFSFFFLLQVLLQELSSFVFAAKMKTTEKGSMNPLKTVMKLCTQSSSRNEKVKLLCSSWRWSSLQTHTKSWMNCFYEATMSLFKQPSSCFRSVLRTCWISIFPLVQDKVSLISSRLFVLLLPASLLSDLADIAKLLVSDQQVDQIEQLL